MNPNLRPYLRTIIIALTLLILAFFATCFFDRISNQPHLDRHATETYGAEQFFIQLTAIAEMHESETPCPTCPPKETEQP